MNKTITAMIYSSEGYCHETAGVIIAFFNDAEHARRCADKINVTIGKKAEVCGSQLSLSL